MVCNADRYGTREALMTDMRQMADNAVSYNGADHFLAKVGFWFVFVCEGAK